MKCPECLNELPPHAGGPPRRFCSIHCKDKARCRRRAVARAAAKPARAAARAREGWVDRRRTPPASGVDWEGVKTCRDCGAEKPKVEFHATGGGRPRAECKECNKARLRARYATDPEVRARAKAGAAQWARTNPERTREIRRAARWKSHLQTYGLTVGDWDALLIAQTGRCAVCTAPLLAPCVDHCHGSGRVRGLLCSDCNAGIGHLRDDVDRLGAAIAYLLASRGR